MAWLEQFRLVMKTSVTALWEKIEDPERMLHQLIVDMEEELESVRHSVAAAIADEIQLRRKAEQTREEADHWLQRATQALQRGDDSASRSALEQKVLAEQRSESLEDEHRRQQEQTVRLQQSLRDLEDKIRQARQKRTLLLARLARSESSRRIHRALDRADCNSAFTQFTRLEERVERSEALSDAWDRLEGRDPDADELERKFAEDERQERVRRELEALRRQVEDEKD